MSSEDLTIPPIPQSIDARSITVSMQTIAPEPANDIWDVWWKVPLDPQDSNLNSDDARCPKVVLNPDGKTVGTHGVPSHSLTMTFAANLAATLVSAALWISDHS